MKFNENEIDSIETIGELNGKPVKMIRLKGGLCVGVGQTGRSESEVLGSASHPGILKYSLGKHTAFKPALTKSETQEESVKDYSNTLPTLLVKQGYGLYAIQKSFSQIDYVYTRNNIEQTTIPTLVKSEFIEVGTPTKNVPGAQIGFSLAKAVAAEAITLKRPKISLNGKLFRAKDFAK